jgi:hypothetical protein
MLFPYQNPLLPPEPEWQLLIELFGMAIVVFAAMVLGAWLRRPKYPKDEDR